MDRSSVRWIGHVVVPGTPLSWITTNILVEDSCILMSCEDCGLSGCGAFGKIERLFDDKRNATVLADSENREYGASCVVRQTWSAVGKPRCSVQDRNHDRGPIVAQGRHRDDPPGQYALAQAPHGPHHAHLSR